MKKTSRFPLFMYFCNLLRQGRLGYSPRSLRRVSTALTYFRGLT